MLFYLKRRLKSLSLFVNDYSEKLRAAGFTSSHVRDDWIASNCTQPDIALHRRYLVEYASEVFMTESSADILYSDDPVCNSEFLNNLKIKRREMHGSVENLFQNYSTRHLVQLSPCLIRYMQVLEGLTQKDLVTRTQLLDELRNRRCVEIGRHSGEIGELKTQLGEDVSSSMLEEILLGHLIHQLRKKLFETLSGTINAPINCIVEQHHGHILIGVDRDVLIAICPGISLYERDACRGSLTLRVGLIDIDTQKRATIQLGKENLIKISECLPDEFSGYSNFESIEGFLLNVLAWSYGCAMILHDACRLLVDEFH